MKYIKTTRKGAVLLIVLVVVMVLSVLSVKFLSFKDMELLASENFALRDKLDLLAESGIEHARGLLLNSDNINLGSADYWAGASEQQLTTGNDYYDTSVVRDSIVQENSGLYSEFLNKTWKFVNF